MDLYKEIMLWSRTGETTAVRYSCLKDLETGKYAVQSADFFRLPLEEKQFRFFERQFTELFIDMPVRERCAWFDSLEEAVTNHNQVFS